jgi:putative hydrolase of the HAD superfamily
LTTRWLTVAADGAGFHAREEFLAAVRDRYGLDEPLDSMLDRYRERIVALLEPDPQARATIDRLRGIGRQVAITTNGDTRQQRAKIRLAGLAASVDAGAAARGSRPSRHPTASSTACPRSSRC